ncbi:hypothetical protein NM208_g1426 [Fusarium decemcellulare]|uniref:Uncharacterized protein n=1 Tax=Fusarium decemcellulare TaxID=57161 RepID=A0ACC1SW77_9HYPO|nr:hypothetical protein NM208_g1426 [Fusarium decemcellulare]
MASSTVKSNDEVASIYFEPSQQILDSLIEHAAKHGQFRHFDYRLGIRLLLNSRKSPLPCRETPAELEAVSAQFSAQIHALFDALKAFETINAKAEKSAIHQDGLNLTIKVERQSFDIYLDCLHRTFHTYPLTIAHPDSLPLLSTVTTFRVIPYPHGPGGCKWANTRPISLISLLKCMMRLPALKEVEFPWLWEQMPVAFEVLALRHYARSWEGPWRDSRHEFGRAVDQLHNQMPESLRKARMWFWDPDYGFQEDQSTALPNLVHPKTEDPMSIGMRTVASHLEHLDLRAFIMPELFNPPINWPRMRQLRVEFHPWRPDGCWYFVGPRGENPEPQGFEVTDEHYPPSSPDENDEKVDDEYCESGDDEDLLLPDMFRTEPLEDKIVPLLSSFVTALKGMPALEEAEVFTYLTWKPSKEREAAYGEDAPYKSEGVMYRWGVRYVPRTSGNKGLLEWQVGAWKPSQDIIDLFEHLERGGQLEMVWKPFDLNKNRKKPDFDAFC